MNIFKIFFIKALNSTCLVALIPILSIGQNTDTTNPDNIIEQYLTGCASKYNYNYQMNEWQQCLDEGLKKDSTIAYLWQQKAMPYFKVKKYEVGMRFLDKAVQIDPKRWQPYRAFIKCIFQKSYAESLIDFESCIEKWGDQYEMDHPYSFYMALCYLQLNEFKKAEQLLENYIQTTIKLRGTEWVHPTALFYLGITLYEQQSYAEAIQRFDQALEIYKNFSDVKVYKALCLMYLNKDVELANILMLEAKEDSKMGYTINEDNVIYETYPYQKKWHDH